MKKAVKYIGRTFFSIFTAAFLLVVFLTGVVLILEFGPSETARNLFVNSAMETSAGKFLATLFFSDEKIAEIMALNEVVVTDEVSDSDLIVIEETTEEETPEEELQILEISGATYSGFAVLIKDPSRVSIGISGSFGEGHYGKTIAQMCDETGSTLALNGGGFDDPNGKGTGAIPTGIVMQDGEILWGNRSTSYEIIGFDSEYKLVVGTMTGQEALDRNVQSALSFGPTLIVNGNPADLSGSGSGMNPRSAIGQAADGTVILLCIDGRQANSLGATYEDLINIMLEYGAVNAANLDGGSSTYLYYQGEYINKGASMIGPRKGPTCILVE
jgi:exopolysaccharide biosynthesis protein